MTYRWEISVWLDDDAEGNARAFARLVRARDPVRGAPHERLVSVEEGVVNARVFYDLLDLLDWLLLERLLHSACLIGLLGCRIRCHISVLIGPGKWLLCHLWRATHRWHAVILHRGLLRLPTEWILLLVGELRVVKER